MHLAEKLGLKGDMAVVTKKMIVLEVVGNPVVMENEKIINTLPNQMTNQALHTLLESGFKLMYTYKMESLLKNTMIFVKQSSQTTYFKSFLGRLKITGTMNPIGFTIIN